MQLNAVAQRDAEQKMETTYMNHPTGKPRARQQLRAGWANPVLACAVVLLASLAGGVNAQVGMGAGSQVSLPNGYVTTQGATLSYGSSGGGGGARSAGSSSSGGGGGISTGSAGLKWDGREWKLGAQWDSLSQSWKNMTGSNTADTTGGMGLGSTSGGSEPGCWVWVDEDWQPSPEMVTIGGVSKPVMVDGVVQMAPMVPIRTTPFNRIMGDGGGNKSDYAPSVRVSLDYATLCMGSGAGMIDAEALRLANELYLGDNGRYAFNNSSVLEKKPVQMLVAASGAPGGAQINIDPQANAKGYRKTDKNGDWVDYNTQGQVVAMGDRNNNTIWLQRDSTGRMVAMVDGSGRVLQTLHYTGELVTEVRDQPVAGLEGDLPARSVKYRYDERNRLTHITDARGYTIEYGYDASNRINKITDQEGRVERIVYEGDLIKQRIAPDGGVTDFEFDYDNVNKQFTSKIIGPETAAGRRVETFTHNRVGKLVRRAVNGKVEAEVRYDTGARAETSTNARGYTTRIVRNEYDQITEVTQPDGSVRKTTYSAQHLGVTEETDELGFKTQYQYDAKGNLVKTIQAVGTPDERVTEYERDSKGLPRRITRKGRTESNGTITPDAVWQVEYDAQDNIRQTIDPEGHKRSYVFNRVGDLVKYTNPQSQSWTYTYDANSNPLTEKDPLGRSISYTYDKVGNLLTATDERGKVYSYAYDAANRQTSQSDPLQNRYSVTYDVRGALASVKDASGKTMRFDYDALARLTRATDGKGQTYGAEYTEADGTEKNSMQPSKVIYPTMQRVMRYNERDNLALKNEISGSETRVESYGYDKAGQRKTVTDANGKTRTYEFNAYGQVTTAKDPLGNTLRLVHDTRGNVIEAIDPNGGRTRASYDRRSLLVSSTDPLGNTTRYEWNNNGWLSAIVQANGQKVTYGYDNVGRVNQHQEHDAQGALQKTVTYTYDEAGNLLTWSDGTFSALRSYDDADQLTNETVTYGTGQGNFTLSHAYSYHGNGQIKTYTGPDGVTISYEFDGAAQLERVEIPGEGTMAVTDWQWFQPKKVLLPGGSERRMEYDGYQGLTQLKVVNPSQAAVFELKNQYGKLAEIQSTRIDGNELVYTHDDAGRLTQVNAGLLTARSETFTLDANGNRLTHSQTGSTQWQYDAAGRLTQRPSASGGGTTSYQYDASGNLSVKTDTSRPEPYRTTRYSWDAFNRLAEVKDGAGHRIARYTYDPFDRRIRKERGDSATLQAGAGAPNSATHYLHTEWGLLAEADGSGQLTTTYGWNPQKDNSVAPLFARTPDTANPGQWRTVYYHNDHLGAPQRITDKSGAVIWAADYDAYGKAITRTTVDAAKAITSNLRYPGQYWDAETGLHYNDRRYYDPETGRYLSSDPIGFEGGINLYAYAAAAPGRYIDPTGEFRLPNFSPPCMLANYAICNVQCNVESALGDAFMNCGEVDWAGNAKDCLKSCLFAMLPIPDPCGLFGKLFGALVGSLGGGGGNGDNSFTGDTLVHVRDRQGKPALKPISDIKIGDEVLAWDEMAAYDGQLKKNQSGTSQQIEPKAGSSAQQISANRYEKVSEIITSEKQQRLVHITLDSGKSITATDGHPFRTSEGWRDAVLLKKGGKLLLKGSGEGDDDSAGVATIENVRTEVKIVRVYNLEVENLHTFFVGEEGYVVHNGRCTPKMRKEWEKLNGRPWPKNPMTEKIRPGGNRDGHHIIPVHRNGHPTDPRNIVPMTPTQHAIWHRINGYK